MFNKIAVSLSLCALLTTPSIAEPIDISAPGDEVVPVMGTFKIYRARNPYTKESTVRNSHRDEVNSKIEFTLGEKSSLTCSIDDKLSISRDTDLTKFPPLQFSEAFLKEEVQLGVVTHRNAKYLRNAVLHTSVDNLLDETSKNALYAFILERVNKHRQITMEMLQKRLPGDISFKFFLYPPHRLFTSIDPVEGPYYLSSEVDPTVREEALKSLQFKRSEGIVAYEPHLNNGTLTIVSTY